MESGQKADRGQALRDELRADEGSTEVEARRGKPAVWMSGLAVVIATFLLLGMLFLISYHALSSFWPDPLHKIEVTLDSGETKTYLAKIRGYQVGNDPANPKQRLEQTQFKIANRRTYGRDFIWVPNEEFETLKEPDYAAVLEREEYGDAHGIVQKIEFEDETVEPGDPGWLDKVNREIAATLELRDRITSLERELAYKVKPLREVNTAISTLKAMPEPTEAERKRLDRLLDRQPKLEERIKPQQKEMERRLSEMRKKLARTATMHLQMPGGDVRQIPMQEIYRIYLPNDMTFTEKVGHYLSKFWSFYTMPPREANTEGGIFPAIVGTVLMVLIMTIAVVPLGVVTAIYLHEYAKPGPLTSLLRISINNLAGVPSIVFGVFGLGFFIYTVGGGIDQLFFSETLPSPTFGTGGLLWASLTLALLTIPVVVVAAEEGLASVPQDVRDAALSLGSTKWQALKEVLLPGAIPGILTGVILAVARAAGEVAPLMLVGVVKLAPSLPVDQFPPYLHLDRKFMHLGFHIYDTGFQSPNVEASEPLVYLTAFTLVAIVLVLNGIAIYLRNRMRRRKT